MHGEINHPDDEDLGALCAHCAKPATCIGRYEDGSNPIDAACDECCGHGNEDGWCVRLAEVPSMMNKIDRARKRADDEVERLRAEFDRLTLLINTPRIDEFFEAVRIEAAHQVERWGVEHDAGKRPEDWITLFMYLLGKAAKAHFDGNRQKLLHHIITVAAVALNWHRNATGEDTRMRPGVGP